MEHVVFYTGADSVAHFRRTASLEEAVRCVEHLSNVEGVTDSRVYALSEVPLRVKTVVVVEMLETAPVPAVAAPTPAPVPVAPHVEPPVAAEVDEPVVEPAADPLEALTVAPAPLDEAEFTPVEPAPAEGNGKAASGSRSLGFFARG